MRWAAKIIAACAMTFGASSASAAIYTEMGDAGRFPATAQSVSVSGTLDAITGRIGNDNGADMFRIHIANPAAFGASTVGTGGSLNDTQLFLFGLNGMGIAANDDAVGGTGFRSRFPVGNSLYASLPAGDYLLLITAFNRDPVSAGGLIFPSEPSRALYGPTGPGGASPITGYDQVGAESGTYRIDLLGASSATVPEPSTLILFGAGAGLMGLVARRRRK